MHKNLLPVTFSLGYAKGLHCTPCQTVRIKVSGKQEDNSEQDSGTCCRPGPGRSCDGGAGGTPSVVRALHTKQNGRDQGTPWASQDTTGMPPRAGGRVTVRRYLPGAGFSQTTPTVVNRPPNLTQGLKVNHQPASHAPFNCRSEQGRESEIWAKR